MGRVSALLASITIATAVVTARAAEQPAARVAVTRVFEKETTPTTSLIGSVLFDQDAGISSEVNGLIERQQIAEGAVAKPGDVLVKLNTDFIVKDMKVLDQQIIQIDLKIENSLKNLRRLEILYKANAASEQSYDDLLFQTKEQQAEKERLLVTLAKKKLELEKSVIRAPFRGLILKRYKSLGEWVQPGEPICRLAAVDDVMVQVALSEDLMPYVKTGQAVTLTVIALDKTFQGRVQVVVPSVDVKSKTFDLKIKIPYTTGLFQNMSARVEVPTGPAQRLLMIKRDALVRFQGKTFVYTVKDGHAKILPIEILAIEGEYLGVKGPPIVEGMPVVIDGNERLRPDQPVTVVDKPENK